jgi:2-dehydropantoate 2-reductase
MRRGCGERFRRAGWREIEPAPHRDLFWHGMKNQTWCNIAVVGAGAIGCYFGGVLARAGRKVTLIGRHNHVEAINRNGLFFQSLDVQEHIAIAATANIAAVGGAQVVLFCVKSVDTEDAARKMAPHLARDAVVLSLQNGVDNVERIRLHVKNQVLPVLVYAAAQMSAPGCVRHTGGGNLIIGQTSEFRSADASDRPLPGKAAALFIAAGIPVKISEDIEADLWTKLVMNCAYNGISALSGACYGQMVAMPEIRDVMCDAVKEVVQVAHAKGVRLPGNIAEAALELADAMPQTISSTAQDILKGKRTEIDHLNGYVVRQGEALGIGTPVNQTINALMKLLEQTKLDPSA